jgi:hypothetical protein
MSPDIFVLAVLLIVGACWSVLKPVGRASDPRATLTS